MATDSEVETLDEMGTAFDRLLYLHSVMITLHQPITHVGYK